MFPDSTALRYNPHPPLLFRAYHLFSGWKKHYVTTQIRRSERPIHGAVDLIEPEPVTRHFPSLHNMSHEQRICLMDWNSGETSSFLNRNVREKLTTTSVYLKKSKQRSLHQLTGYHFGYDNQALAHTFKPCCNTNLYKVNNSSIHR